MFTFYVLNSRHRRCFFQWEKATTQNLLYQSLNLCTLDELFLFKLGNHKSSTKLKSFHLNFYLKGSFPSQVGKLDREVQYFQVKLLLQVQEKILRDFLTIEDFNFYYNLMISLFNRNFVRSWVGFKIANSTT